jgi:hypothetical protein
MSTGVTYNPWKDPKFYTVVMDAIITLVTLLVRTYYPIALDITIAIIASVQAVAAVLLKGFFDADISARIKGLDRPHLIRTEK